MFPRPQSDTAYITLYFTLHVLAVLLPQRWNPATNSITSVSAINMRYTRWGCKRMHVRARFDIYHPATHPYP